MWCFFTFMRARRNWCKSTLALAPPVVGTSIWFLCDKNIWSVTFFFHAHRIFQTATKSLELRLEDIFTTHTLPLSWSIFSSGRKHPVLFSRWACALVPFSLTILVPWPVFTGFFWHGTLKCCVLCLCQIIPPFALGTFQCFWRKAGCSLQEKDWVARLFLWAVHHQSSLNELRTMRMLLF